MGTNAPSLTANEKIMNMMKKQGYKEGTGLGRHAQGRVEPIQQSAQSGRIGLGHEVLKGPTPSAHYDPSGEIKCVEETPEWLSDNSQAVEDVKFKLSEEWIKVIPEQKKYLDDEDRYCQRTLVKELLACKNIFDHIKPWELNKARARANPYETVKAGFFQNRAAMKTANIDRIYDWSLSRETDLAVRQMKSPTDKEKDRVNADRDSQLFYFADVCAGPGGFTEYMLWRKAFYNAKGFGFTLAGNDDFKLDKFLAASPEFFETYYGRKDDGNVMDPENLSSLEQFVKSRTHGDNGVHLVMCDGGFSVAGQENIQEILSKRLYLCQFIVGLSLPMMERSEKNKPGGNFLCKLFDLFTPFSVGLVYLMHAAFKRISLHKPITSRPANSERYIFCENLTEFGATIVKDYLVEINNRLDKIAKIQSTEDIYEIVPENIIRNNTKFFDYVVANNECTIKRQIFYLKKYHYFANNKGAQDIDQWEIRNKCLEYWELPNVERAKPLKKPLQYALQNITGDVMLYSYGHNRNQNVF